MQSRVPSARPGVSSRRRRRAALVGAAAVATVAMAGCGSGGGGATSGGDAGDTLTIDASFVVNSLDPQRGFTPTSFLVNHGVYETLVTYEGDQLGRPRPLLARSFRADRDARVFTFELDPSATFADGARVTSADVVFSLRRLQNLKADGSYLLDGVTVTAPDVDTVVLRTRRSNAALPAIMANPVTGVVNARLASANGATDAPDAARSDTAENWFNSADSAGAGSGPYTLGQYDPASQITLARNERAWAEAAPFETVVLRNMQAATQATNVQRGKAEIALDLTAADVAELREGDRLDVAQTASRFTFFAFGIADPEVSPVTANPKVQEAIRYGLDYDGMKQIAGPGAEQMPGVVPSWMPGHLDQSAAVRRDVARARAALAAAGPGMDRLTLDFPSDTTLNGLSFATLAVRMQESLQEVGFEVKLEGSPIALLNTAWSRGRVPFGVSGRGSTYMDATAYLDMSPGELQANRLHWTPADAPEVDALAARARAEIDQSARDATVETWQEQLNEIGPYYPLVAPVSAAVSTRDLSGVALSPQYGIDLTAVRPAS